MTAIGDYVLYFGGHGGDHLTTIANKVVVLELRSSYEVHTYQFSDQVHYTVLLPFNCLNFLSYLLYPLITLWDLEYLISLSRQLNLNQYMMHLLVTF